MILFVAALIIIGGILEYWSIRHGLDGVTHTYGPSQNIVEPGETFNIVTKISNPSLRFISYMEVREDIPEEFEILPPSGKDYTLFLMPRRSYNRSMAVKASKRGRYILRGSRLTGGDFLGLKELYSSTSEHRDVVVIPAPYRSISLNKVMGGFLGDISVNRFIMEDPVLTMGFREYTGHEPMKMISWTQSARNRSLIVKKYDYTLEMVVTVLLNVECELTTDTEPLIEDCFSMARTVCETLEDKHIKYSFITNAYTAGQISSWDMIGDGLGQRHLLTILEGLGRASYGFVKPFDSILRETAKKSEAGRSHIIIMPEKKHDFDHTISQLEERTGGKVLILTPEEEMVI